MKVDAKLAQSDRQKGCVGRQLVMFKGESSKSGEVAQNLSKKKKKSGEGSSKPKIYSKYQPKMALKGCAGEQTSWDGWQSSCF